MNYQEQYRAAPTGGTAHSASVTPLRREGKVEAGAESQQVDDSASCTHVFELDATAVDIWLVQRSEVSAGVVECQEWEAARALPRRLVVDRGEFHSVLLAWVAQTTKGDK